MKEIDLYIIKGKCLITISVALFLISCGIHLYETKKVEENSMVTLTYENVNIKDMATANIKVKESRNELNHNKKVQERKDIKESKTLKEVALPIQNNSMEKNIVNRKIWYLPCEIGNVTNSINPYHYAIDITSPRKESEPIYPIANGIVSSIYTDTAGAKIVTINHNINGQVFTSQYVHLSSYSKNLYVGKEVTINDCLGYMGSTGIATGVHLHLALVDCSLYDSNGACPDLASFFSYGKQRISNGFYGPYSVMDIPTSWNTR